VGAVPKDADIKMITSVRIVFGREFFLTPKIDNLKIKTIYRYCIKIDNN
jgi:hypothetical protein